MPTPERTSHTAIVEAGREILESDGPAGLTMQAVATRVGVRAPSLYKRIRNRDALLAAVAEATVDDLTHRLTAAARLHSAAEMPGNSVDLGRGMQSQGARGAREELVGLAEAFRAFAHERPEGFRLMFTASAPLDALEHAAAPVLHAARALVGDDDALDAARLFTAWATGFLQMELAGAFRLGGDVDDAFDYGLDRLIHGLAAG
ncbi:TetR/AcrR family transcriptional regulator [Microbacterium aerolatum]|uniref:TetR family transcriptional regulator n=1 Tax=Microbacterium aerolatum TaxID=153731 RepID=A0A511AFF3_9MICO|nr:TetR/AcrR family transcriptional regulator [Microbacterium aerolatum]GEK85391.1 TetR family transcriptional regulator [Microbacterium aerolatum]GGB30773.1 TetR family transcriptional regulator [Microbacterium aerolatum]